MRKSVGDWLKVAGELRDGFLVMAAVCYFFGYIVWAITAYRNNLGLLPALDFQYFVAGAPLVLIILAISYIVIGVKLLRRKMRDWAGPTPEGWSLYLCTAMGVLALFASIMIFVNITKWFQAAFPSLARSSGFVLSMVLIIVVYTLIFPVPEKAPREPRQADSGSTLRRAAVAFGEGISDAFSSFTGLLRIMGIIYTIMLSIVLPVAAFLSVIELYERIPQEFGGARPQDACLDVVKAQISNETIEGILPVDATKSNEPVVRSSRVEVLFSGSDVMIIRSQGRVYKITKSAIQTVTTCN